MTDLHPITPPPQLVELWRAAASNIPASYSSDPGGRRDYIDYIVAQASQWAADAELEACCEWLVRNYLYPKAGNPLRAARRPKPPSLKEQALEALFAINDPLGSLPPHHNDTIRTALEALPND